MKKYEQVLKGLFHHRLLEDDNNDDDQEDFFEEPLGLPEGPFLF